MLDSILHSDYLAKILIIAGVIGQLAPLIKFLQFFIKAISEYINKKQNLLIFIKEKILKIYKNKKYILYIIFFIFFLIVFIIGLILIYENSNVDFIKISVNKDTLRDESIPDTDYYILRHEVTTAMYSQFWTENDSSLDLKPKWFNNKADYWKGLDSSELPITGITWYQANKFCDWYSIKIGKKCKLPTLSEWKYAAKAGGGGKYGMGYSNLINEIMVSKNNLYDYAWYNKNEGKTPNCDKIKPVMKKFPNALGLYDMWGNAKEWTTDDFRGGKAFIGGSWKDPDSLCYTDVIDAYSPEEAKNDLSFRIVYKIKE